jgi:hypothetical protein
MSRHFSNQLNYNYNVDKLNFNKIKKELETIPKIMKNHNKIGLRKCSSMTDINNNDPNISNNLNEESDIEIIKNFGQNLKSFSNKKSSSFLKKCNDRNNGEKNDLNNSSNNDTIIQIKKENIKEVENIKNLYEKKIKEITLFYENKIIDLNKLLKDNLNDYKLLCSNYISLTEHKKIINDLKKDYNELLNETKENYEKLINELTSILKSKNKYQDLIHRLQLYTKYEVEINDIEKILVKNINEKIEENKANINYFNDFYLLSQLDEDINYHKKICELKQIYNENMSQLRINNNNQLNNLINQVKYIYDNYLNYSSNKFFSNKQVLNKNKDVNNDMELNIRKKSTKIDINNSAFDKKESKSISNTERNSEYINHYSSKENDNLLDVDNSNENHLKPEKMEINYKPSSFE